MMDKGHKMQPNRSMGGSGVSRLPTAVARNEVLMRSPTRKGSIDPTKDKLAYFKDNVQDPHDQEEDFDPNMYYYHRQDKDGLEHLVPAGAPGSVGVHFPNAVGAGPGVGAFSTASPVYGVHGAPMQMPGGRPVVQMVPGTGAGGNPAASALGPASFAATANLGNAPNAQFRFPGGGVPITVLGRTNSGGAPNMPMAPMGARGPGAPPGIAPPGNRAPPSSIRSSGSGIATPPAVPTSTTPPPSPMRSLGGSSGGLNTSSGMSGMGAIGMGGMGGMGMSNLAGLGTIAGNMGGMTSLVGMNMNMQPTAGYAQTLQAGLGGSKGRSDGKQIHIPSQEEFEEQDGQEHDGSHEHGIELEQLQAAQPLTQAQILRQSLNGLPTAPHLPAHSHSHPHIQQIHQQPLQTNDSFDSGFSIRTSSGMAAKQPEFSLAAEDFPALPLKASAEMDKQDQHNQDMYQGYQQLKNSLGHSGGNIPTIQSTTPLQQMQQTQKILQSPLRSSLNSLPQPTSPTPSTVPASHTTPGFVPDRFGLLGLLSVIRMTDPDLNTLALGTDLTTLGLNLNSPDCLYATFASPFADGPSRREPDFYLPACYYTQPPMQPASMKMTMFSEETLLYIFYSMPRDVLQLHAASELYNRDWRYHKEHKLWFSRVPGTEAVVKTATYERGSYYYFDPNTWEKIRKDNFVLCYDQIDTPSPKP